MTSSPSPLPAKLPFWRTVGSSYAMPFSHLDTLGRVTRLWLAVLTPVLVLFSWLLAPMLGDFMAKLGTPAGITLDWQLQVLSYLKQLVVLPAIASIAVAWHRFVLADEKPHDNYLQLDRSVWLYAGYLLAAKVVLDVVSQFPACLAAATGTKAPHWASAAALLVLPLSFIIARYSPILVAVALERSDISLGDVWQATRRNTWRLALGPLACLILLALPSAIAFRLGNMSRMSAAIVLTLLDLTSIVGGVIGVSFLSLAYRHLFPGKPRMRVKGASQFVPALAH
jgi:hypothetical protein